MHGFDHGFSMFEPWPQGEEQWSHIWKGGGEFLGKSKKELLEKYKKCNDILSNINKYLREHFIFPFNALNQEIINVLHENNVKYLHLSNYTWKSCEQYKYNYSVLGICSEKTDISLIVDECHGDYSNTSYFK
jgi:hypothetical protein